MFKKKIKKSYLYIAIFVLILSLFSIFRPSFVNSYSYIALQVAQEIEAETRIQNDILSDLVNLLLKPYMSFKSNIPRASRVLVRLD
jgi:multisubunit Na+/H+ antiporter MnhB subunit